MQNDEHSSFLLQPVLSRSTSLPECIHKARPLAVASLFIPTRPLTHISVRLTLQCLFLVADIHVIPKTYNPTQESTTCVARHNRSFVVREGRESRTAVSTQTNSRGQTDNTPGVRKVRIVGQNLPLNSSPRRGDMQTHNDSSLIKKTKQKQLLAKINILHTYKYLGFNRKEILSPQYA